MTSRHLSGLLGKVILTLIRVEKNSLRLVLATSWTSKIEIMARLEKTVSKVSYASSKPFQVYSKTLEEKPLRRIHEERTRKI